MEVFFDCRNWGQALCGEILCWRDATELTTAKMQGLDPAPVPRFRLDNRHRFLLRWGVSREFSGFGDMLARVFGAKHPHGVRAAGEEHVRQKDVYAELAKAPQKAVARRNPLEGDPDAVAASEELFGFHCAE